MVRPTSSLELLDGLRRLHLIRCDLASLEPMREVVDGETVVVHCAACRDDGTTAEGRQQLEEVNVAGTRRLIEICQRAGVPQLVLFSSSAAMGDMAGVKRDETQTVSPTTAYGRSKLRAEQLALAAHGQRLQVAVLRPGVVYGPGDRGTVLKMIRYIDTGRFRFIGSRRALVPLVGIDNVCAAVETIVAASRTTAEVYLVVDGQQWQIGDVASLVAELLGVRLNQVGIPRPAALALGIVGDVLARVGMSFPITVSRVRSLTSSNAFSASKLESQTGYRQCMTLRSGLEQEVAWYRRVICHS